MKGDLRALGKKEGLDAVELLRRLQQSNGSRGHCWLHGEGWVTPLFREKWKAQSGLPPLSEFVEANGAQIARTLLKHEASVRAFLLTVDQARADLSREATAAAGGGGGRDEAEEADSDEEGFEPIPDY